MNLLQQLLTVGVIAAYMAYMDWRLRRVNFLLEKLFHLLVRHDHRLAECTDQDRCALCIMHGDVGGAESHAPPKKKAGRTR